MTNTLTGFFINHFLLAWASLAICIVAVGISGSKNPSLRKVIFICAMVLGAGIVGTVAHSLLTSQRTASNVRRIFISSWPSAKGLRFQTSRGMITINNQAEVMMFGKLIQEASTVEAHHSYPVNNLRFWLDNHGQTYRLGQDSNNADEFWLGAEAGDNLNVWPLKQFQSRQLSKWLVKNVSDYSHSGLNVGP